MKKEKLVVFDWGGIVDNHFDERFNYKIAVKNIIETFNGEITYDYIKRYFSCSRNKDGKSISSLNDSKELDDWIIRIFREFKIIYTKEDIANFKKIYREEHNKCFKYIEVADYIESLYDRCYTGILSNLIMLDGERIRKHFDFSRFDFTWLSYEVGMVKPDKEIYKKVIEDSGFDPKDILFIDDISDNVYAAKSVGINVLCITGENFKEMREVIEDFIK